MIDPIDDFLSWMASERGRSANTLAAYRRDLEGYTAWLAAHGAGVATVDRAMLDSFVQQRRASGAAA